MGLVFTWSDLGINIWPFHGGTYSHVLSVVLLSEMSLKVREIAIRHCHLWPGKAVEPKLGWFLLIRTVRKLVDSDNSSPTARTRCHRFLSNSILNETEQMLLRSAACFKTRNHIGTKQLLRFCSDLHAKG